jgi:hypothetical protein
MNHMKVPFSLGPYFEKKNKIKVSLYDHRDICLPPYQLSNFVSSLFHLLYSVL